MAKNIKNMKEELLNLYFDTSFMQSINCSQEENKKYQQIKKNGEPLPHEIHEYKNNFNEGTGVFFKVYKSDLTKEEKMEYILLKQLKMIRTIKNCVIFFTVIVIIALIAGILIGL